MIKNFVALFFLYFLISNPLLAQSDWIFDDTSLPVVNITIHPDSLDFILDGDNSQSDHEFPATFSFTREGITETVENIGFRLRGNTSRKAQKKSFKVSFNTFPDSDEFHGLDKMNLNGEHNDPTILRAKLSWDIFEKAEVIAPRANHVKLYINDEYFGLYLNVEHIDDEFVKDRFGSDAGNLFKCLWPADLTYKGSSPKDYENIKNGDRPAYELKTNLDAPDYSDLAVFISFLKNADDERFKNEIETYLNVDGVIRWMAIDILTGNWDNYWYNKNNYYLYHDPKKNRFEFIPYDYDNTFGIDFIGPDWGTQDINDWGPNESRPLTERILGIPEFKNRLHFYLNEFITSFFNETELFSEIDRLYALTKDAAEEDLYRTKDYGFTVAQYNDSFTESLGGHVKYGLKPYITTRANSATSQLQLQNISPIFRQVDFTTLYQAQQKELIITAELLDEDASLDVTVFFPKRGNSISLLDNGAGADVEADDGIYSGTYNLSGFSGNLNFYIEATDAIDTKSRYPSNPAKELSTSVRDISSSVVVNEFMADNNSTISDESESFEDYIELFNNGSTLSLANYYLTDDFENPDKWALPDTVLGSKQFILIWADGDIEEGPTHAPFGLSKGGEEIAIFYKNFNEFILVDSVSFGEQAPDQAFGRATDGDGLFGVLDKPSPGFSNHIVVSNNEEITLPKSVELGQNFPNPFNPETTIPFKISEAGNVTIAVYSISGQFIKNIVNQTYSAGEYEVHFDASELSSGVYLYQLSTKNTSLSKKLVLVK